MDDYHYSYKGGKIFFDTCGMEVDDVKRGDEMTRGREDQGTK
jgi:hypothetical protein